MIFDMDETLIHKLDASDSGAAADVYLDVMTEDNLNSVKVCFTTTHLLISYHIS